MLTILYKSIAVRISRKSIWNVCGLRPVYTSRNVPYLLLASTVLLHIKRQTIENFERILKTHLC